MRPRHAVAIGLLIISAVPIVATLPAFASGPTIRWEIENRFRYFKKASDFRALAEVYEDLQKTPNNPKPTVLMLEQRLEEKGLQGRDNQRGWAASIFEDTCGWEADATHARCQIGDNGENLYLAPLSDITANLILYADGFGSVTCEWRLDDTVVDSKPCDKPAMAKQIKYNGAHTLEVRPSGAAAQSAQISLKDLLIISFGDSFSAGEGNPERPVKLVDDPPGLYGDVPPFFPVRTPLLETTMPQFFQLSASWSNSQCHRSLYSQHARAALQYALEHPHVSVTFVNYSCTGAEVYEGILNAWWGRAADAHSYDDAPQLVKALRDLCKNAAPYKRTKWAIYGQYDPDYNWKPADFPKCQARVRDVDVVLLSIGGNDVGFANMIVDSAVDSPKKDAISPRARYWVYGLWREVGGPQDYATGSRLAEKNIPPRYRDLNTMLRDYLGIGPGKVILSAYPQVGFSEKGDLCPPGNRGMDVHAIFGMSGTAFSGGDNFTKGLRKTMETAASQWHWLLADQHVAVVGASNNFAKDGEGKGHGICAAGPPDGDVEAIKFPRPTNKMTPFQWEPFHPSAWNPYSPRNRWLVTPNDAFLTTNYHDPSFDLIDPSQPVIAATLSGAFHPNALGHAAVADSVLIKLREALRAYEN